MNTRVQIHIYTTWSNNRKQYKNKIDNIAVAHCIIKQERKEKDPMTWHVGCTPCHQTRGKEHPTTWHVGCTPCHQMRGKENLMMWHVGCTPHHQMREKDKNKKR